VGSIWTLRYLCVQGVAKAKSKSGQGLCGRRKSVEVQDLLELGSSGAKGESGAWGVAEG
jgi:hypothetical protein